jgi:hypothetical protein
MSVARRWRNHCWGGVVRYDAQERKFTVDDTVCNDARFYHLEFSMVFG